MSLEFEGKPVRAVTTESGQQWVAADVCAVLGLSDPSKALSRLDDDESGTTTVRTSGQAREMLTVTEPGLYSLVTRSRKTIGKRFRRWLFHEVVPCIHKHGCYPEPEVVVGKTAVMQVDSVEFTKQLGAAIREACRSTVTPVENRVGTVERKVDNIQTDIDEINHKIDGLKPRKPLAEKTKKLHRFVVRRKYSDKCPCCQETLIMGETGQALTTCQYDHWDNRSLADKKHTWAICSDCNAKLRDPDWKNRHRAMFEAYQQRRREVEQIIAGPVLFDEMEDADI